MTFGKSDWKPIKHGVNKSIEDMEKKGNKSKKRSK